MIAKLCVVAVAHGANVGTDLTTAALTNASRICSTAMCSKYSEGGIRQCGMSLYCSHYGWCGAISSLLLLLYSF